MKRKIYNQLLEWKKDEINMPLMIIGARQIGKTYIINEFCQKEFEEYIYINLLETPEVIEFRHIYHAQATWRIYSWLCIEMKVLNHTKLFYINLFTYSNL